MRSPNGYDIEAVSDEVASIEQIFYHLAVAHEHYRAAGDGGELAVRVEANVVVERGGHVVGRVTLAVGLRGGSVGAAEHLPAPSGRGRPLR